MALRVVPFRAGLHHGVMSGPFVILRFPLNGDGHESEPATVYVDVAGGQELEGETSAPMCDQHAANWRDLQA